MFSWLDFIGPVLIGPNYFKGFLTSALWITYRFRISTHLACIISWTDFKLIQMCQLQQYWILSLSFICTFPCCWDHTGVRRWGRSLICSQCPFISALWWVETEGNTRGSMPLIAKPSPASLCRKVTQHELTSCDISFFVWWGYGGQAARGGG